jgi:hypothetical protein
VIGILSQWKAVVYGLLFVAVLGVGWWLADRITRSYEADFLEKKVELQQAQIMKERKLRVAAEKSRLAVTAELVKKTAELSEATKGAVRRVKAIIPENTNCDFPDELIGVLNAARRGELPSTAVSPSPPPASISRPATKATDPN